MKLENLNADEFQNAMCLLADVAAEEKTQNQNCGMSKLINDGQEHFAKEKREEIPKGSNSGYLSYSSQSPS